MIITKESITKYQDTFKPKCIFVLVDEMSEVMTSTAYKLVNSIQGNIASIARLGRAGACHLVLATQRPSSNVINADLKNNVQISMLLGDFDASASTLIFDEDISNRSKPEIKGRGFVKSGKDITEFQSFWTEVSKDFVKKDLSKAPDLPKEAPKKPEALEKTENAEKPHDEAMTRERRPYREGQKKEEMSEEEKKQRESMMAAMQSLREQAVKEREKEHKAESPEVEANEQQAAAAPAPAQTPELPVQVQQEPRRKLNLRKTNVKLGNRPQKAEKPAEKKTDETPKNPFDIVT